MGGWLLAATSSLEPMFFLTANPIHPSLPIHPFLYIYFVGSYKTPIIGQKCLYNLLCDKEA